MKPTPSKRVFKKADIEKAAMELFARRGFAGATIKEIAALAGVTEGALYRHYAGKEEMAAYLFERELGLIRESLKAALKAEAAPGGRLKAAVTFLYESYRREPWPLLFVILNFQNLQGENSLDDKGHIYDDIITFIKDIFTDQIPAGDPEFLATLVAGLVIQPVIFHYYGRLPRPPAEYIEEITGSLIRLAGLEQG